MMNDKTITNIRINKHDWQQVKIIAAELNISVNEYLNSLIKDSANKRQLGLADKPFAKKSKSSIWDLPQLAKISNKPIGELSEEDKTIYET